MANLTEIKKKTGGILANAAVCNICITSELPVIRAQSARDQTNDVSGSPAYRPLRPRLTIYLERGILLGFGHSATIPRSWHTRNHLVDSREDASSTVKPSAVVRG
jgi:hypothetical protein